MTEQELKTDIELLKKDIVSMSGLIDRFDTTIDKIQDISFNLSKMVSLQEQRIENQETMARDFHNILENRRLEHNQDIKDIYDHVEKVNTNLTQRIESTEKAILAEIEILRKDLKNDETTLGKRLGEVEMWKYAVGILFIVAAWFIGQANLLDHIFGP